MNIIEVTDIKKSYRRKKVLTGASFHATPGECIGIVGANGCGKSTLLNILSGSLKADSGQILYSGKNPLKSHRIFSEYIGFVPQENPLMNHLSVYDNLRLWYCDSKRSLEDDLNSGILAHFGLSAYRDYDVATLSGGMKKRLSIACALAKEPPILILDEPGASLDIVCKEDIKNYLASYQAQGNTTIITSHETGELSLCDRMYLLKNGVLTELYELAKPIRQDSAIADILLNRIYSSIAAAESRPD